MTDIFLSGRINVAFTTTKREKEQKTSVGIITIKTVKQQPSQYDFKVRYFMDHSGYGLSQWETQLQCDVVSHWAHIQNYTCICVLLQFALLWLRYRMSVVRFPIFFRVASLLGICRELLSGIILGMGSANERRRYNITSSLICWTHTQNVAWLWFFFVMVRLACLADQCGMIRLRIIFSTVSLPLRWS